MAKITLDDLLGAHAIDKSLAHVGVKGMRWGFRKADGNSAVVNPAGVKDSTGSVIKKKGDGLVNDRGQKISTDAAVARVYSEKAKKNPDSLSNDELRALITRTKIEREYISLNPTPPPRTQFLKDTVKKVAKKRVEEAIDDVTKKKQDDFLVSRGLKDPRKAKDDKKEKKEERKEEKKQEKKQKKTSDNSQDPTPPTEPRPPLPPELRNAPIRLRQQPDGSWA